MSGGGMDTLIKKATQCRRKKKEAGGAAAEEESDDVREDLQCDTTTSFVIARAACLPPKHSNFLQSTVPDTIMI